MISGLNSSSISLAIRTAQRAEKTVTKSVEQIATGKKVASVKDDAATYIRATLANSEKAQIEGRRFILDSIETVINNQVAQDDGSNNAARWMADIARRALDHVAGTTQRQQLNAEFQEAYAAWSKARAPDDTIVSGMGSISGGKWGINGSAADSITSVTRAWTLLGSSWLDNGHAGFDYAGNGVPINAIDVLNGNTTNLKNGIATLEAHLNAANQHSYLGGDARWIDRAKDISNGQEDRIDSAISAMTDADLGKVSRDRDLAQTRQQLAYQTVKNAISQYGNVSSSLLNNVMGTQRSVRA